jgi:UDP-glucose 4-epimerase
MKVLITGGMGVIGAEATRKFVLEGHRPVIYARRRDERLIADVLDRVEIELGDITDAERLTDVLKKHAITHIVHAAGYVSAPSAANVPQGIFVNVMGTTNVLEAARQLGIERVVFTDRSLVKTVRPPISRSLKTIRKTRRGSTIALN